MKVSVAMIHNMVHWFAWKQVKRNVGITVKWREQQQKSLLLGFETAKKRNFSASRLQRLGMTSPLKQLLADCFKTFSGRLEDWTVSGLCHL